MGRRGSLWRQRGAPSSSTVAAALVRRHPSISLTTNLLPEGAHSLPGLCLVPACQGAEAFGMTGLEVGQIRGGTVTCPGWLVRRFGHLALMDSLGGPSRSRWIEALLVDPSPTTYSAS